MKPILKSFILALMPALLISLGIISCTQGKLYDETFTIQDAAWKSGHPVVFNVAVDDTSSSYRIYLTLRNTTDYPFSNLYVFITTATPYRPAYRDTLVFILASPEGVWLGKGIGGLRYNSFLISRNIRFPGKGKISFRVEQAMRVDELTGIHDVGMQIVKQ